MLYLPLSAGPGPPLRPPQNTIFTETFDALTAVAISRTGTYWAAASRRGEIRVWDAGGQTLRRAWRAHANMIYHLTFSPDGQTLASGGWDGRLELWEVETGALLWSGRHTSHINNVAFAPDGSMIASSGDDATLRLWDRQTGTLLQTLPHLGPVSGAGATWSPDSRLLATGDLEGYIRLWAMSPNEPAIYLQTIAGHTNWVDGLAFSPDGRSLASASFDGTVKLWDVSPLPPDSPPSAANAPEKGDNPGQRGGASLQLRQTLTGHTSRVYRVAWSPDGRSLASSSFDQTIWLWDVERGNYRAALLCGISSAVNACGPLRDTPGWSMPWPGG